MFEKFGELNSFGEINELAENLFNEGDTESLKAMAKENGIQSDFVDMYLQGEIPVLCDQLTAALGKIDVEVAELKPKEIMEDWVEYLRGQCIMEQLMKQEQDKRKMTPMEKKAAKQIVKNLQRGPMNRQERRARERKLRPRKNPRKH